MIETNGSSSFTAKTIVGSQMQSSLNLNSKSAETTTAGDLLLQVDHALLVASWVSRVALQVPGQELVGVVGHKGLLKNTQSLSVRSDLLPVTVHVLEILRKVRVRALVDLAVHRVSHLRLDVDVLLVRLSGVGNDIVGGALDSTHERCDLVLVRGDEGIVGDVQNGTEAAASKLGELVNAEHLDVVAGAALTGEPLLELNHLDVLESDTGVDGALDDGLGDVHAAANGGVLVGRHTVVPGELVDLDLAELTDVADALALERGEVGGDTAVLEVNDAGEGLVEEGADGGDGEVTSFGLEICQVVKGWSIMRRLTARVWIIALNPMSTFPLPMISVTSSGD